MPTWHVTEPTINLFLRDQPFTYQPSRGREVTFHLTFKNISGPTVGAEMITTNIFSFGTNWHSSWRSYVRLGSGSTYELYLGDGALVTNGLNTVEYETQTKLTYNSGANSYILLFPSGATNVYSYAVTDVVQNVRYFLTKRSEPEGFTTTFQYTVTNNVLRLTNIVDSDSQNTTFQYTNINNYHLIYQVNAPYGRTATLAYDGSPRLTNITDTISLSSKMEYASDGTLTNLITPYGSTTFTRFSGSDYEAMKVDELGLRKHFYMRLDAETEGKIPNNYVSEVPSTTNGTYSLANKFDTTNSNERNSFYWAPKQYEQLTALVRTNLDNNSFWRSNLTSADFKLSRLFHWLKFSDTNYVSFTLSLERAPSPDGVQQGQISWYDYAGKANGAPAIQGTLATPCYRAVKLPNGQSSFQFVECNEWGHVTNQLQTYIDGSVLRSNKFQYAANGIDLTNRINAGGSSSSDVFNGSHQVMTNYNELAEETTYIYGGSLRLISVRQPSGLITTNIYGSDGRLATVIEQSSSRIFRTNSYTSTNSMMHTHTDPRGLTITNAWDALGRILQTTYPDGTTMTYTYSNLDLVQVVDRMGFTNRYEYNGFRQRIREINALGFTNTYSYCSCGTLDAVTDPLGNTTSYTYDSAGRQTRITYPGGSYVEYKYDLAGRVTNQTDSAGVSITSWYNNQGLLVASSNAVGQVFAAIYDAEDNATNHTDANGVTITETFDELNRVIKRTYPDGGSEKFGYSARGLIAYTNQLGKVTRYVVDALGRKQFETNALNDVVSFTYSPADDLLILTNGNDKATFWNYDLYGRVTNKIDALGTICFVYRYDANGRMTNRWTPAKTNTFYAYDAAGNLTNIDYQVSPDIRMQYDANNRLTNMVDAVGTTRYTYTAFGALQSEDGPWDSDTVSSSYDNGRRRSGLNLQAPSASDWVQSYGYDAAARLQTLSSPVGAFTYTFKAGGSLVTNLWLPNGAAITNQYDSAGRLLSTVLKNSGNSILDSSTYKYNLANQRTNVVRTDGSYVNYTYDDIEQLKTANGFESNNTARVHEKLGYLFGSAHNLKWRTNNGMIHTFNNNAADELISSGRSGNLTVAGTTTSAATNVTVNSLAALRYSDNTFARTNLSLVNGTNTFTAIAADSLGRLDTNVVSAYLPTTNLFAYDDNGNLTSDERRGFDYDDENQLIHVTVTNAWKSEFSYDGKKRKRVRKEFTWQNNAWLLTNEVRYLYDGGLVVQERDGLNVPTVSYTRGTDLSGTIEGAGGIGGLLARTDNGQSSSSTHAYYHSDANGNVTMLINMQQLAVAKYLYDPFGNTLSLSGPLAEANVYRFSSKEYHANSGMVYYLYRFYEPTLQRWINRDPIGEKGGENLYQFARSSPIHHIDPWGLRTVTIRIFHKNIDPTQAEKAEVNRILQDCIRSCVARDCKGNPKHKVRLVWLRGQAPSLGFTGGGLFNRNPTGYNVYVEGDARASVTKVGRTVGDDVFIGLRQVIREADRLEISPARVLATTIAHEVFHHAIGGTGRHFTSEGFVDSTHGKVGGKLSNRSCNELCNELDID